MLHRDEGHVDAGHAPDLARPLPGADHELVATDPALVSHDGAQATVLNLDAGDAHAFFDGDACIARALGERHGDVRWRNLSVGRKERRADDIVDLHQWPEFLGLLGCEEMHLEPEGRGRGRLPFDLGPALRIAGEPQAAVLLPPGGEACVLLEPVIEVDGVTEKLGDVGARAQLSDEARGVPRRAGGKLPPLEKEHVGETHLSQMIGHRASDDAAADDYDLGGRRQRAHARSMARQAA